jgi:hypothetical protein
MTLQKVHNHTIEDLVDSEGDESSVSVVQNMMIRKFKEFKDDIQKQLNEFQDTVAKKLRRHRNN